jgi:futalosine hydrolase
MRVLVVSATKNEVSLDGVDHLVTGIGMVATAIELSKKLSQNKYDLVINAGIAGSFNRSLKIGQIVEVVKDTFSEIGAQDGNQFLSPNDIELDVDSVFHNEAKTSFDPVSAITVNTIHGEDTSIVRVMYRLNPQIETMEGAAFFMTCQRFSVKCIQLRSISNYVEKRNKSKWDIPKAIKNLNIELNNILNSL